jgi:hypothetical protein
MDMIKCKICREPIPEGRLKALPNTVHCSGCSREEAVGCVDIVYHKTGNTIQVMPKEQADAVNKAAKRSGFGTLTSMKGGSGGGEKRGRYEHQVPFIRRSTQEDFELCGSRMMAWVDLGNKKRALADIEDSLRSRLISPAQARQLRALLDQMMPEPVESRPDVREGVLDQETQWAFKNWKNCKTIR